MRNERIHLHCLSGFLSRQTDWDDFAGRVTVRGAVEIFAGTPTEIFQRANHEPPVEGRPYLLSYSLGGRIAMAELLRSPSSYRGAIFASVHPGLKSMDERRARVASDEVWARRFESEEWGALMRDWDAQPVFAGGRPIERQEGDFSRAELARCLREHSLGRQEDLLPSLLALQHSILWIAGERDEKFAGIARGIAAANPSKNFEIWIAPGAGHRVPWDVPEVFARKVRDWIFERALGKNAP